MKKLFVIATLLTVLALPAQARTYVDVNGLVCDFCAQALEKVFSKQEAVEAIDVDLDTKVITIDYVEGQSLDKETIRTLVSDAGYNVVDIRDEE